MKAVSSITKDPSSKENRLSIRSMFNEIQCFGTRNKRQFATDGARARFRRLTFDGSRRGSPRAATPRRRFTFRLTGLIVDPPWLPWSSLRLRVDTRSSSAGPSAADTHAMRHRRVEKTRSRTRQTNAMPRRRRNGYGENGNGRSG